MPQVAAAAAAWAAQNLTWAAVAKFAIGVALSMAASYAASALSKRGLKSSTSGRTQVIRSAEESRKIIYGVTRVSGVLAYANSTGSNNEYAHILIALASNQCQAIGDVYFNDKLSSEYNSGYWAVNKHLGAADQAADIDLRNADSNWTMAHKLCGITYVYCEFRYSISVWPTGLPNISAIVTGKNDIYDPRTETTGYTNNPALCILDYLQLDMGMGMTVLEIVAAEIGYDTDDVEIDLASFITAANICDEEVALDEEGTETQVRYTCDGVIDTGNTPRENLEQLLTSCAGRLVFPGGVATLYVGAYVTPTWHLNEDDLRGDLSIQPQMGRADLFNTVRGTYVSPDTAYESTDFPEVTSEYYVEQDREKISTDVELPFTTDPIRAQRIAKVLLEEQRQPIIVEFPAKWMALGIRIGTTGTVSISQLGWTDKVFRCDGWKLGSDGITLTLREVSADAYEWNYGNATTYDTAPNTGLADPFTCAAPVGLTLASGTAQLDVSGDGTIISRILATWAAPSDAYVTKYEVEYKTATGSEWKPAGNSTVTQCYIAPVSDKQRYDVRVRAVNSLGVPSAWVTATNYQVIGKSEPPTRPDTFLVSVQPDGTREFTWTHASPDRDVRSGGGYRIRYVAGTSGEWDSMTPLHQGLLLASPYETNRLDAGTYVFAIKSVDSSGNESTDALWINGVTIDTPRLGDVVYTAYPHTLGWPGTLTDCSVADNGWLEADDAGGWDDLGDTTWDEWLSWAISPAGAISYEHPVIDLGAAMTFTPFVVVDCQGAPVIEVAASNDNSTWGDWQASATPLTCRYLKVRFSVAGDYPVVRAATIFLSARSVTEDINDLDTSTLSGDYRLGVGDVRLPIGETYHSITQVRVTLQNTGAGWSWELIDKDTAVGPRIKIYNASAAVADAVIDAEIRGK